MALQPAYRSTFGVAKDSVNTTLSAAVAAAAVVVPIVGTGVAALSTITIVDGPLTESRAVTAGGGTSSLTVAALTSAHSANTYVTSQLTASLGPVDYIPVTVLEVEDQVTMLRDKGLRGSAVESYGNQQGPRWGALKVGGDMIIDTFPYFLGGVTGAVDFAGGTPNTHTFATKNTSDSQPTPFTFWDFNSVDTRIYAGCKVEEVTLNYDPSMLLTWTASMKSWMSGPVAATISSFSAVTPSPAWLSTVTIGGSANLTVLNFQCSMKRPAVPVITAQGIQDPYKIWSGVSTITGSMSLTFEDITQLNNFLNNSQPAIVVTWTNTGANPNKLTLTMTKCNYDTGKPKQTGGAGYLTLDVSFEGLANTTDANTAGTGYAPFRILAGNAKATGTFQ